MIIKINRFDVPVINNILGKANMKRMSSIEVQAVEGRDVWTGVMGLFSSKGMKEGYRFYFVPFRNIYGAAEDVGYDIFEKLYGVSDAIRGIFISHDAAGIVSMDEWREFEHPANIPLAGGGGYILKIKEVNFPALTHLGDRKKNAMQGLIIQGWGVERERLKRCFSNEGQEEKITVSSRIGKLDAAFYVPMDNLWDALEEKDPDAIPAIRKAFGPVEGLNFALSDVSELYLPPSK
ncbi:MAG: hypothetical protein V1860_02630 [bacterium]